MKKIWKAKVKPRNTKKATEKAKMSDLNCQIILKLEVADAETRFSANI